MAATWYSHLNAGSSFDIDVSLSDGQAHRVSVYAVDWDSGGRRSERIDVINAATGAVLGSQTIGSFQNGEYLSWTLQGNVIIRVTNLVAGNNAVVSGVFFGAGALATASFAGSNTTTQGNWRTAFGGDGYSLARTPAPQPLDPLLRQRLEPPNALNYTWAASTTDPRALQNAAGTGQLAATWYSRAQRRLVLRHRRQPHRRQRAPGLDLRGRLGATAGSQERVDVINAATGAVLDSETIGSFQNGEYLSWNLQGSVILRVTNLVAGNNAVVSGVFFGPGGPASASFAGANTAAQGNWMAGFGGDGYGSPRTPARLNPVDPLLRQRLALGALNYTWAASTTDPRGLQNAAGTGRLAATWYSQGFAAGWSFDIDVSLSDGKSHRVSVYAVDWEQRRGPERAGRRHQRGHRGGLDTRTISSFQNGEYLSWNLQGNVIIRVTNLVAGNNAVVSGIFFG